MQTLPYDAQHLRHLAGEIITNVRELAHAGWTPATSSNFSRRLDDRHAAITVSGRDKGRLTEADIMVVDFDGNPVGNDKRAVGGDPAAHPAVPAVPGNRLRAAHALADADGGLAPVRARRPRPLRGLRVAEGVLRQYHPRRRDGRPGVPEHPGHARTRGAGSRPRSTRSRCGAT
jgi:hypothetical protein